MLRTILQARHARMIVVKEARASSSFFCPNSLETRALPPEENIKPREENIMSAGKMTFNPAKGVFPT